MSRFLPVIVIAVALSLYQDVDNPSPQGSPVVASEAATQEPVLVAGRQAEGSGTVIRILPDDNDGSRHQRFIIRLASGRTLLIAHNIDLAPRINSLKTGDTVAFFGEFESNPQGGVIHWTHHDPQRRHPDGWLKHGGRTYQ